MRAYFLTVLFVPGLLSSITPAQGRRDSGCGQASRDINHRCRKETPAEADAAVAADESAEFTIPPGFREKKRGQFTLYCRKESKVGTRFPEEKCYDENGIREMLRAQAQDREKFDQLRRVCGNPAACGGP